MRRAVRALLPSDVDRRGILSLSSGHAASDMFQGAIPAILPFLVLERGYSYTQVGALLLVASFGSALFQPLLGTLADRRKLGWIMPAGLFLAGGGYALVGVVHAFWASAAALLVGGLGVAAFHPEAIRFASNVSRARPGAGMSLFALGGSVGFVLGPVVATPVVLGLGLAGTPVVGGVILGFGLVVLVQLPYLESFREGHAAAAATDDGVNDWRRFGLTSSTAVCRAIVGFGLQAFVPAYVIADLGHGEAVANATVTTFFAATLVGTLLGGQLADRFGFTRLVVGAIATAAPLSLVLPVAGLPAVFAVVAVLGVIGGAYFYPLVVLAQRAVPSHLGLAAGVVLGMSIGLGSAVAFPLGMLADAHGPAAALWAIAGFSLLSLVFVAGLLPRRASSRQASAETAA